MFKFFFLFTICCFVLANTAGPAQKDERFCHTLTRNAKYTCYECKEPENEKICGELRVTFENNLSNNKTDGAGKSDLIAVPVAVHCQAPNQQQTLCTNQTQNNVSCCPHGTAAHQKQEETSTVGNNCDTNDDKQLPVVVVVVLTIVGVLLVQAITALLVYLCKSVKWKK